MRKSFKKGLIISLSVVLVLTLSIFIYLFTGNYKRGEYASEILNKDDITIIDSNDYIYFKKDDNTKCMIFYPGAKVDSDSYSPLAYEFTSNGIDFFILKFSFNLAFFHKNVHEKILNEYDYSEFYLGGHSLGGLVTSSLVNNNSKISALLLLASYPNKTIKCNDSFKVVSIYGSNDGVLNFDNLEKGRKYVPENYFEFKIEGANHAGFADYGKQKKDLEATITNKEQITITVNKFIEYMA